MVGIAINARPQFAFIILLIPITLAMIGWLSRRIRRELNRSVIQRYPTCDGRSRISNAERPHINQLQRRNKP